LKLVEAGWKVMINDGNFELLETDGIWKLVGTGGLGTGGNWKETKKKLGASFGNFIQ
jgi:hypothetical protein